MKKILLISAFLLTTGLSYSQLNVVETSPKEEIGKVKVLFDTYMESYKRGEDYTILYKDMEYQQLDEFKSFSMNEQTFNELYDLIIESWDNPPKEDIMIELPESFIWLKFTRMLGATNFQFVHDPLKNGEIFGLSTPLNKKKVDKLFGK
jgi:hypothetical protein